MTADDPDDRSPDRTRSADGTPDDVETGERTSDAGAADQSDAAPDRPGGEGWYDEPPEDWDEEDDGSVFGPTPGEGDEDVDPGDPRLVHVLFVVLGALAALGVMADLVGLL